jgi:hypothetical protein
LFIDRLANFFALLFANLGISPEAETLSDQNPAEAIGELLSEGEPLFGLTLPPYFNQIVAGVIMLILAAAVTYFLSRYFRQPAMAAPSGFDAAGSSGKDTSSAGLGERLLQRLGIARRWRMAASIRRIYEDMCFSAAEAGYPRSPAETPYEYLKILASLWPDNQSEAALITEAYIRVRYGEIPETEEELRAIKTAWQALSAVKPATSST